MSRFLVVGISVALLIGAVGCRKQVSTLHDDNTAVQKVEEKAPDLYRDVDTSNEASFVQANLSDDLSAKVKENLQTVYFDYNSFVLTPEAITQIQNAAAFLKENKGIRVLISGHCDERGSSDYNMGLGESRARAVRDYLNNYGIESIRMETTSMGKEQPVVPNCGNDESCHSKNRRAEFTALAR